MTTASPTLGCAGPIGAVVTKTSRAGWGACGRLGGKGLRRNERRDNEQLIVLVLSWFLH